MRSTVGSRSDTSRDLSSPLPLLSVQTFNFDPSRDRPTSTHPFHSSGVHVGSRSRVTTPTSGPTNTSLISRTLSSGIRFLHTRPFVRSRLRVPSRVVPVTLVLAHTRGHCHVCRVLVSMLHVPPETTHTSTRGGKTLCPGRGRRPPIPPCGPPSSSDPSFESTFTKSGVSGVGHPPRQFPGRQGQDSVRSFYDLTVRRSPSLPAGGSSSTGPLNLHPS